MNILPMDRSSMGRISTPPLAAWSPKAFSLLRATTLRILARTHLLHRLIQITSHVFSTKTTCHVILTCQANSSWWLMQKNLSRFKLVLNKRSPSYANKTNKISVNWNPTRSVCNEQTIRSTVAFKQAFLFNKMKNACCCCLTNHFKSEFNDAKETADEQRWSRNTKTPVVTRLLTRSTTNPKTATINSDFWHDELGDPMTVQRPVHREPMHRKLEKCGGNISQGSFLAQKSLTRMTTLLVSANACKDETKKRTDFISFLGVRNC